MKYVIASAVVALLILAPLGSYYYLRSGFAFRMNVLKDLEPKQLTDEEGHALDSLVNDEGKVILAFLDDGSYKEGSRIVAQIDDKIVDKTFFAIHHVDLSNHPTVASRLEHPMYLLDTNGVVRHMYDLEEGEIKDIIRHLAVLIPMPKRKEIVLKRELPQN